MRIVRFLFGIYASVFFVISLVFVGVCYAMLFWLAPKEKAPYWAHQFISRPWAKALLAAFFIRIKVRNEELIDRQTTYIFIANHRSQLDVPAYAAACKNTIRFLAKAELTKIPFMGYVIKHLYVSVNRKDKGDRLKSMEAMKKSLKEGISVFLCPEGTRNKTSEPLLDFREGSFRLAIESQTPMAVLTVKNTGKLLSPLRPVELSPGVIECIWSKPIETAGMTINDLPRLIEMAKSQMIENLK